MIVALVLNCGLLQASLTDLGNGIIRDDRNTPDDKTDDRFWIQDLSRFEDQSLAEQLASIESLNEPEGIEINTSFGIWRIASKAEVDDLGSYGAIEIAKNFISSGEIHDQWSSHIYWYGVMRDNEGYCGGGTYRNISETGHGTDSWITNIQIHNDLDLIYPRYGVWIISHYRKAVGVPLLWLNFLLLDYSSAVPRYKAKPCGCVATLRSLASRPMLSLTGRYTEKG